MYIWRKLTDSQRARVLAQRKLKKLPFHSPPHLDFEGEYTFIITAACFEHKTVIGKSIERMSAFEEAIIVLSADLGAELLAWCILPNHYHLLLKTDRIAAIRKKLGSLHGRTARQWNLEDNCVGRQVWFNFFDREMKSLRHYWASLNYVHNNAVHHEYVKQWQEWPFSSAARFLEEVGREKAAEIWKEYPVRDYGKSWDIY